LKNCDHSTTCSVKKREHTYIVCKMTEPKRRKSDDGPLETNPRSTHSSTGSISIPQIVSKTAGSLQMIENRLCADTREQRPLNTKAAYDSKCNEFISFCDTYYAQETYPRLVTPEKVLRNVRKRGRSGKTGGATNSFNQEEYERVMAKYASYNSNLTLREIPIIPPTNPVGYSVVNQTLCSILKLLEQQIYDRSNSHNVREVKSQKVKELLQLVKDRKIIVARNNYREKIDHELLPYLNAQQFPELEAFLWGNNADNACHSHNALASLRNRDCLLSTKCGILRGESLFQCELSDILDLEVKFNSQKYPSPILVSIQQIGKGKVNLLTNGHKLFGRHIRHKDPRVSSCCTWFLFDVHIFYNWRGY